jgi:DNA-binding response OmpR family regulator
VSDPIVRCVIVDDEPLALLRLRSFLQRHGDVRLVGEADNAAAAAEVIRGAQPDVVFLDIEMPGANGFAVLERAGVVPPPLVVFVTAYAEHAVHAFEARALDYLLKPFAEDRFAATLDRIRTYISAMRTQRSHEHLLGVLRELSNTPLTELERLRPAAMPLRFADLEADTATRDIRRAGRPIALRPKEYDLLVALMRRAGEVVTRRELLVEVWGYHEDVSSRTVDTHVAVLRRKLGHQPDEPGYIVTVAKVGYRLRE